METSKRLKQEINNAKAKRQRCNNLAVTKDLQKNCNICKQSLNEILIYNGHPNNSSPEYVALTNETLSLFTGTEEEIHEKDCRPMHKITNYTIYDENGHLCAIDSGLVEDDTILHMSGYIKPIYEHDSSTNNGIATHNIGPINEWYITGFDGGDNVYIGIISSYAEYVLMQASPEYRPKIELLLQKIELLKLIIEFLLDYQVEDPTYEDLLDQIKRSNISEEFLLQNADFICNQICSFDSASPNEDPLMKIACIETLLQITGVELSKVNNLKSNNLKTLRKKLTDRKATSTELVKSVFKNFFKDQIHLNSESKCAKKRRCGICDSCQSPDCGKCVNCKDMLKFGGLGKSKQACKFRMCPNMDIDDNQDYDDIFEQSVGEDSPIKKMHSTRKIVNKVHWPEKPFLSEIEKEFHNCAIVGDTVIRPGDYVMLSPYEDGEPLCIAKVKSLFDKYNDATFHARLFCRGINTILGETANPQELFATDVCEDCPLGSIIRTAQVEFRAISEDWQNLGGAEHIQTQLDDDNCNFHYTKKYDRFTARFTDYAEDDSAENQFVCSVCIKKNIEKTCNSVIFEECSVKWRNEVYNIGSCVFLKPSVYKFPTQEIAMSFTVNDIVDEDKYPEYYRKSRDVKNASSEELLQPFCVGRIEDIHHSKIKEVKIKARIFFRPENTKYSVFLSYEKDLNLVYWTEEVITISFDNVVGKCYLKYFDISESASEWSKQGPYRFYFKEAYDPKTFNITEVSEDKLQSFSYLKKNKGKGKCKFEKSSLDCEISPEWNTIKRPLKCMDIFAGCGGLSLGLHQAKVANTTWAIENVKEAAEAFKLNNNNCKIYVEDCNKILKQIISGNDNTRFPAKGEVELLVGGPPCQGFSDMNRFNSRQYSLLKNSLIATILSYCDYYRPKYFILENVRNFVSFKRSIVLKLTIKCLLEIGYQVTFGILQASHFGLPQSRRRFILIAAAPGCILPNYPEPQNVSDRRDFYLPIVVDGIKYFKGNHWTGSSPYRQLCVRDAISDLPAIPNGFNKSEIAYEGESISHFQKLLRENNKTDILYDHVCKEMAPIVETRISYIPLVPGSDWRDLPNISIKLRDNTVANKLQYNYYSKKQNKLGRPRAVCSCSSGKTCSKVNRQINTLIPWCLPHTADRHNNWAGLYGRLEWNELFRTTITNPEPMGKQGRVIHPEQNRVVSVRECARSQGFPDEFKFYGNIMDKHRQIGNAVPPPLGRAIGLEIRNAIANNKSFFHDEVD